MATTCHRAAYSSLPGESGGYPPSRSFSQKNNSYFSPPPTASPPFYKLNRSSSPPPPPPSPSLSSNDSTSGTGDPSSEIAIASLGVSVVATLANLAGLGFAYRQDGTSRAELQLATALAIRDLIAAHGVDGTRVLISSGVRTRFRKLRSLLNLLQQNDRYRNLDMSIFHFRLWT
jgi:hypothetical protein